MIVLVIVAFMTVKYHSVNVTVTYCCTIMNVLSHYHKDMIVIELPYVVLAVFESCLLENFCFEGILK